MDENESVFSLPSNIRQIGAIGDGVKIYVEDYVNTYLKQYAESGVYSGKLAFLVGKEMTIDNHPYVFISGAIQNRFGEFEDGIEMFTEKSFAHAEEQINIFFPGNEIVGWMQSQPGFGTKLNKSYDDFHKNNFTKPSQILFVMDPVERLNVFYAWNNDFSGLTEIKGYFVYYDKNNGMQEYMLENKISKLSLREKTMIAAKEAVPPKSETIVKKIASNPHGKNSEDVKSAEHARPASVEYKRVINMLVGLSAVLFVICFIMGAGLVQGDGRLSRLEKNYTALDSAYSYIVAETAKLGAQAKEVFANNNDPSVTNDNRADNDPSGSGNELSADVTDPVDNPPMTADNGDDDEENDLTAAQPTDTLAETPKPPSVPDVPGQSQGQSTGISGEYEDVPESYVVQQGDNLYYISLKFYGTIEMVPQIMELNEITDPDTIYFGKVLQLPVID